MRSRAQARPQKLLTAIRLAELAFEVGFPAGAVNVLAGDEPITGGDLVKLMVPTGSRPINPFGL